MTHLENCRVRMFCAALASLAILGLVSCASLPSKTTNTALREHQLLDAGWRFHRGEVASAEQAITTNYEDGQWTMVNLPHDYMLDGVYSPTNARSPGYLPVTTAWYRKHFFVPAGDAGKTLQLEFGGIFRDSQVWLNGHFLGRHVSGYTGFYYDITQAARYGEDNVIAVRVDPRHPEGWWYEGSGIYRHAYLNVQAPLHVAPHGTYVVSDVPGGNQGADAEADLTLQTTVENLGSGPVDSTVVSEILGPHDTLLQTVKTQLTVAAGDRSQTVQHAVVSRPRLWSPDSPALYKLRTTIIEAGRPVDATVTTFGIRTISFDADEGFFLNGKHLEIQGVANHQDFPAVGIAVPDSLEAWRVKQLKQMGCNAWRTAHNPPNEEVLDECDRQGLMVMDENRHLGDSYDHHSRPGTTATNLADLAFMIQRDRNHPSIIMWSLCNEEGMQGAPEGARLFSTMMNVVHQYDRTRPITCAMSGGWLNHGMAGVEDIIGVNYGYPSYDAIHRAHPHTPMFGSEMANNKTARGEYAYDRTNGWVSAYNLTDPGWKPAASRRFFAGSFTWTGFDYKGEPNPDGWPDISNNTGLMDVCGFPKDKYYFLESWWSPRPMVHLLPARWNWPGREGQPIRVIAFSNAREVELFLNGKSLGRQTMPQYGHLEWEVPYEPGQLLAKGFTDGRQVATDLVETMGAPVRIQLSPDRRTLQANGEDAVVIPVALLDAQGRLVSDAGNRVHFELTGGGRLLGVGNGNPSDHDPDRANERNAFNGHCIAIIQAGLRAETLRLTATSPGLAPASVAFQVR